MDAPARADRRAAQVFTHALDLEVRILHNDQLLHSQIFRDYIIKSSSTAQGWARGFDSTVRSQAYRRADHH